MADEATGTGYNGRTSRYIAAVSCVEGFAVPKESILLRAQDLRALYLLLGECFELGADPLVWRRYMLVRLNALFGAVASVDIEAEIELDANGQPSPRVDVALTLDEFSTAERSILQRCMREMKMEENALGQAIVERSRRKRGIVAGTRSQFVSTRDWQRCGFVTGYLAPLGWSESMVALAPSTGRMRFFNFVRERGERCFSPRHATMLELMVRELAAAPETRLAPMSGESLLRLPSRLQQVLAHLVQGDNEKQIALTLGISRSTVHEYIRRLHSRFGVTSRGLLLARVSRHLHALEFATDDHGKNYWFFQQTGGVSRTG